MAKETESHSSIAWNAPIDYTFRKKAEKRGSSQAATNMERKLNKVTDILGSLDPSKRSDPTIQNLLAILQETGSGSSPDTAKAAKPRKKVRKDSAASQQIQDEGELSASQIDKITDEESKRDLS